MAYSLRYGIIYDLATPNSVFGNSFLIYLRDKYQYGTPPGGIPDISYAGETPVELVMKVDSRDIFEPLRFFSHVLNLISISSQDWESLLNSYDDDRYQISTDQSSNEIRTFINIDELNYRYKYYPFEMKYEGYEGFHILSNLDITDNSDNPFTGKVTVMEVISAALNKLPHNSFEIRVVGTLLEDNHVDTESWMSQTYFDAESLYNDENNLISCLEAIKRHLEPAGYMIAQYDYNWYLVHVSEINVTNITVHRYSYLGVYISQTTMNNVVEMTDNSEPRATRKNWTNANAMISKIPGYRNFLIETKKELKATIHQYTYFETFRYYGAYNNELPEFWYTSMIAKKMCYKYTDDNYTYRGKNYKCIEFREVNANPAATAMNTPRIRTSSIYFRILNTTEYVRMKVTIRYRINYYKRTDSEIMASWGYALQQRSNGVDEYYNFTNNEWDADGLNDSDAWQIVQNSISSEFSEETFEFVMLSNINDTSDYIMLYFTSLINMTGDNATANHYDNTGLIIKNLDIKLQVYNTTTEEYEDMPLEQYRDAKISNKYAKGEYKKELYYGDAYDFSVQTEQNIGNQKANLAKYCYDNIYYYTDGVGYYPTTKWDYNTSPGLSGRTLDALLMSDLLAQYSDEVMIINGDLQIYNYNMLNNFYSSSLVKILQPLNVWYDFKRDMLSGEFMQNKLSVPEAYAEEKLIVDEEGEPIQDELGESIEWR